MLNPFQNNYRPLTDEEEEEINAWFEANPLPPKTPEEEERDKRRNMAMLIRLRARLKASRGEAN